MTTVENSNLINWADYPEYVCALVLCNNKDIDTSDGLVMPQGTEFVWLISKIPTQTNTSELTICDAKVKCIDGFGVGNGLINGIFKFLVPLELHIKPNLEEKIIESNFTECEA